MTDFWADHGGLWQLLPGRNRTKLQERFHDELAGAPVMSPGSRRLACDGWHRLLRLDSWETTLRRNEWFQDEMLRRLKGPGRHYLKQAAPGIFFSYSYSARKLMAFFKSEGWSIVLGQIDPGPKEEEIVARETERESEFATSWHRAPALYWERWREECKLADVIWVNSPWSAEALRGEGIPEQKLRIMPLVYPGASAAGEAPAKLFPKQFTHERPLRVLFLGQINIRKGAHLLLRAARQLRDEPVAFWMVGPTDLKVPETLRTDPRFRWTGPVSRSETERYYREADLFILPTLSDGFALTQLEAQARGLPVLASRYCGEVVRDGRNGLLLDPLTEDTLVEKLRACLTDPERLKSYSRNSRVDNSFLPGQLDRFLEELGERCGDVER